MRKNVLVIFMVFKNNLGEFGGICESEVYPLASQWMYGVGGIANQGQI